MMVIYLPVKFEFDWSNRFKVRVRKRKNVDGQTDRQTDGQTDVGHINLIGGLVTRNPPKKGRKEKKFKSHRSYSRETIIRRRW